MNLTRAAIRLTDAGARVLLDAAVEHARAMGVPQCITIVDEGCNLLAFMPNGRRASSQHSLVAT